MTDAHINYLLGDREAIAQDDGLKWLHDLKKVPFYDVPSKSGTTSDAVEWKREIDEGGNRMSLSIIVIDFVFVSNIYSFIVGN